MNRINSLKERLSKFIIKELRKGRSAMRRNQSHSGQIRSGEEIEDYVLFQSYIKPDTKNIEPPRGQIITPFGTIIMK